MMPSLSASSPPASVASVAPAPPVPEVEAVPAAPSPPVPSTPPVRAWRPWRFALVTVATLLTLAATASLGQWQRSRAAQKIALQAGIEAQKLLPPLDQDEFLALGDPAPVLHRPVRLRGLWLGPQTTYLDNRQMHGLTGFYVLTPFAIEGSERTVLVQRGWIPRNFNDRALLAPVETPSGLVEITALVASPPGRLLDLGSTAGTPSRAAPSAAMPAAWAAAAASAASDAVATVVSTMSPIGANGAPGPTAAPAATSDAASPVAVEGMAPGRGNDAVARAVDATAGVAPASEPIVGGDGNARPASAAARNAAAAAAITAARDRAVGSSPIRQNLDLNAFRAETRLPLRTDLTLQQTGAASEGLLRDWPAPALGVEKHYGYAFQWFGLTGLVALLYVWFQLIVPWRRSRRHRRG